MTDDAGGDMSDGADRNGGVPTAAVQPSRARRSGRPDGQGPFVTIGDLARELGVGTHVLRYWEGKFEALRPVQRAGGRRYYRPEDVALARRIKTLLGDEGRTVAGARRTLELEGLVPPVQAPDASASAADADDTSGPRVTLNSDAVATEPPGVAADERRMLTDALLAVRAALEKLRSDG